MRDRPAAQGARQYLQQRFGDPSPAPEPPDDTTADLARLRPHLSAIINKNGKANKSEIARRLALPTGGGKWSYVGQLAQLLEQEAGKEIP